MGNDGAIDEDFSSGNGSDAGLCSVRSVSSGSAISVLDGISVQDLSFLGLDFDF
jgi:hypothetical protein